MADAGREWFLDEEFWKVSFDFLFGEAQFLEARDQVPPPLTARRSAGVHRGRS